MTTPARILAVVGMRAEARLLARVGITSVVGGGDPARLAAELDRLLSPCEAGGVPPKGERGAAAARTLADQRAPTVTSLSAAPPPPLRRGGEEFTAILSFGVAGGLDPLLKAGDLVIATEVHGALGALGADRAWSERLRVALPHVQAGPILGQDTPACSEDEKSVLFTATAALAVDMESHVAAAAAARHALPFAALRAISDPAGKTLPPAAVAGFGSDGQADISAVLKALARDPRQLPALVRTGMEAGRAFKALKQALETTALFSSPAERGRWRGERSET